MTDLILSISIPTYNRSKYLAECLRSLAAQVRKHRDIVEVVVVDNCSTDDTAGVIRAASASMGEIRYLKNDRNVGVIANHHLALNQARATFVVVAGDDDVYDERMIDVVLATIQNVAPDLIVLNRSIWNHDMTACLRDRLMPLETGLIYPGFMELAKVHGLGTNVAFNSCVVFKRAPAIAADASYSRNAQFPYPQIEIYLQAFSRARCVVVPNLALQQRQLNAAVSELVLDTEVTNTPIAASIGWIEAFLYFERRGWAPFRSLFETREHDHWVDGTMADFIIPNLKRGLANGAINLEHVARVLEAVHKLPEGDVRSRLFEFVGVAIDWGRLTERLLSLR